MKKKKKIQFLLQIDKVFDCVLYWLYIGFI